MNKLLILVLLIVATCSEESEIFPDDSVDQLCVDKINNAKSFADSIPSSLKINYKNDFYYYIKSFRNSTYSVPHFSTSLEIDKDSVYEAVLLDTDSLFVGKRAGENEYIEAVYDTIYTKDGSMSASVISKIASKVVSVSGSNIVTYVTGGGASISGSDDFSISLRQTYAGGVTRHVIAKGTYSDARLQNPIIFAENPDTLFYWYISSDSIVSFYTKTVPKAYTQVYPAEDSIRTVYTSLSNFYADSLIYIDSVRIEKKDDYSCTIKNTFGGYIDLEDSNSVDISWILKDGSAVYEKIIQNETVWTLDSLYKQNSDGSSYIMVEDDNEYIDTLYLYKNVGSMAVYEYYSKKKGTLLGYAESVVQGSHSDSIFVGNSFIQHNVSYGDDTTKIYLSHKNFDAFSGFYSESEESFFIFDINDDGTIVKK